MNRNRMRIKSLVARAALGLVGVIGLWLLAAWLLSSPTSSASSALPELTFASPIPPVGNPQLRVVKTVDNDSPKPGDVIRYTLTYSSTNPGSQAYNAKLYDFLPAGVEFLSSNPSGTYAGGVLLFTDSAVGPVDETATVRARVREGYERLYNYALLTADIVTPTYDSLLTQVTQPPAYLRLTKTGSSAVLVGGEIAYTLRCENPSGSTVNDVTIVDVLPAGVAFGSASPSPDPGWTLPVLTWSLGDLGPGAGRTIVITATAPATAGVITNTALADARQRVMTQTVFATEIVTEAAILRVTKRASAETVDGGDELVYTLRYDNVGNLVATGVVLTDTLPDKVAVTGIYSTATLILPDPLVWDIGTVDPGSPRGRIVITVTVTGGWGETIRNVADIASPDSFPGHAEVYTSVRLASLNLPIVMRQFVGQ